MISFNISVNKILFFIILLSTASSQTYWVKYGWVFGRIVDGDASFPDLVGSAVTDFKLL